MKEAPLYDFSPETVAKKRKFPVRSTVLLCVLVVVQIACILSICLYHPTPQDVIDKYTVYVTPRMDGSLDIEYRFTWTPLDTQEELTWVEIGMANEYFTVYDDYSDNIARIERYTNDDGYCSAQVYFKSPYDAGQTFDFRFSVNQKRMLAADGAEKLYEFVPGWFNTTPVREYDFYFAKYGAITSFNGDSQDAKWLKWKGALTPGDYVRMRVHYYSFPADTVTYRPFDNSGCYNGLASDKAVATGIAIFVIVIAVILEVGVIDAYVSYQRGRGFLRGYGHHVHIYGRVNPRYQNEANRHRGSGGGGGRGCACACACACAGGGRAGCSQKDTYEVKSEKKH